MCSRKRKRCAHKGKAKRKKEGGCLTEGGKRGEDVRQERERKNGKEEK